MISRERAEAFVANLAHYSDVFAKGRPGYAIQAGAVMDPDKLRQLSAFFFWTSWAAATQRPGSTITYTHNWPHEPLVGNRASGEAVVWTGVSIMMLLAGICAMVSYYVSRPYAKESIAIPASDPLIGLALTQSQKATLKYFLIVCGLLVAQIGTGVLTAHHGVEGQSFYGSGCPTASRARGISSSAFCGSRQLGWRRACSSARS
jgi:nitric oxide reductase subunit B